MTRKTSPSTSCSDVQYRPARAVVVMADRVPRTIKTAAPLTLSRSRPRAIPASPPSREMRKLLPGGLHSDGDDLLRPGGLPGCGRHRPFEPGDCWRVLPVLAHAHGAGLGMKGANRAVAREDGRDGLERRIRERKTPRGRRHPHVARGCRPAPDGTSRRAVSVVRVRGRGSTSSSAMAYRLTLREMRAHPAVTLRRRGGGSWHSYENSPVTITFADDRLSPRFRHERGGEGLRAGFCRERGARTPVLLVPTTAGHPFAGIASSKTTRSRRSHGAGAEPTSALAPEHYDSAVVLLEVEKGPRQSDRGVEKITGRSSRTGACSW